MVQYLVFSLLEQQTDELFQGWVRSKGSEFEVATVDWFLLLEFVMESLMMK